MIPRQRLPNRRASMTFALEASGVRFVATVSRFVDGTLAEIFLQPDKVRDPRRAAAGPLGGAVDLLVDDEQGDAV